MSLTGSLFIHETNIRQEFLLDADIHTALLAQRFDGRVHTLPISQSIAHDRDLMLDVRNRTALGRAYEKNTPTHSIVGVGVIGPGHRFFEAVRRREAKDRRVAEEKLKTKASVRKFPEEDGATSYRPMIVPESMYEHLRWLVNHSGSQGYFPVGDVCNRLFFVPPPKETRIPLDIEKGVRDRIDLMNESLLTVTKTQLNKVPTIMLVAGTVAKAGAIYRLLVRDIPRIDTLCIDSATADAVLEYGTTMELRRSQ